MINWKKDNQLNSKFFTAGSIFERSNRKASLPVNIATERIRAKWTLAEVSRVPIVAANESCVRGVMWESPAIGDGAAE
ncbi:MAG: hypothetical protein ABI969_02435 [bacterium]